MFNWDFLKSGVSIKHYGRKLLAKTEGNILNNSTNFNQ